MPDELRMRSETADGGLKIGIAVDGERHGSQLVFGLAWVRPGTEPVSWELDDRTHEAYYVQSGSLRLAWAGAQPGEMVVSEGECFYFPPGGSYTIENAGPEEASFVWAITPALPS